MLKRNRNKNIKKFKYINLYPVVKGKIGKRVNLTNSFVIKLQGESIPK